MLLDCLDNLRQEGWVSLLEKIEADTKALDKEMELTCSQLLVGLLDPILAEFISCEHLAYECLPGLLLWGFKLGI